MNLIVAVDNNWAIGSCGDLLIRIKEDLNFFKKTTLNKVIVYGRETLKTFPNQKPLKNRTNIILSRNENFSFKGAITVHSIEELFEVLKPYNSEDIFVIGGQMVYEQLLPYIKIAYVTKIHHNFMADKYFPNLDVENNWKHIYESTTSTKNGIAFDFHQYIKE